MRRFTVPELSALPTFLACAIHAGALSASMARACGWAAPAAVPAVTPRTRPEAATAQVTPRTIARLDIKSPQSKSCSTVLLARTSYTAAPTRGIGLTLGDEVDQNQTR